MALNVTTAAIGSSCRRATAAPSLVQWDRGQILKITGVTLPGSYNVEFCCQGDAETTTMIGGADGVQVPNTLLERGLPIIAYLVLHEGQDDRETEYWITINVKQRPQPPEVDPDPEQEGVIDQLIAALNAGVESAEGYAADAADSAQDAEDAAEAAALAGESYKLQPNVSAIVFDPNGNEGSNLFPKKVRVYAFRVYNGTITALLKSGWSIILSVENGSGSGLISTTVNLSASKNWADLTLPDDTTPEYYVHAQLVKSGALFAYADITLPIVASGEDGNGIASISKTGTAGLVDTYTVTYTDGNTMTFTVTNGADGEITGSSLAGPFDDSEDYVAGDYVIYSGQLYQFDDDHAAGSWTGSDATAVPLADQVGELRKSVPEYAEHDFPFLKEYNPFGSGYYGNSDGGTKSSNTRIRLKAINAICVHKGDYVTADPPYVINVHLYSNNSISGSTYVGLQAEQVNEYHFQDSVAGDYYTVSIRNTDHPDDDISDEIDDIAGYIHFWHRIYNGKNLDKATDRERFYIGTNANPCPDNAVTTATVADSYTFHWRRCLIALPSNYSPIGDPVPVIMMCHGQHGYVGTTGWYGTTEESSTFLQLIAEYTSNGYAVFDVNQLNDTNGGASNDIGSPEQMEGYIAAWQYVKDHYNVQDRLCIQGYSQGSFAALNFLHRYPGMFKCGLFTGMRASIKAVFDRGSDEAAEIAKKFGFTDQTGATYEADKVIGEDAYANIVWESADKPVLRWALPPVKVVMSEADTTDYQQAYDTVLALRNGGNRIEWRILATASHGTVCAGTGFTEEYRLWFDRFH